jgi:transposase-like protein
VLPEMAEPAGGSRTGSSRQAIEGSAEQLRQLRERRWEEPDLLLLYIDGQRFGSHHVISAVGVDRAGAKHVLAFRLAPPRILTPYKQLFTHFRGQGFTHRFAILVRDRWRKSFGCRY